MVRMDTGESWEVLRHCLEPEDPPGDAEGGVA